LVSDDAPDELLGRDLDVWHVELTSRHAGANESPETFVAQAWPAVEEDLAELRDGAACAIDAVATSVGQTDVGSLALQVYLYGAPIWAAWVGILALLTLMWVMRRPERVVVRGGV
jgi:hypothetical protein